VIRRALRAVGHVLLRFADHRPVEATPTATPADQLAEAELVAAWAEARLAAWRIYLGRYPAAAARLSAAAAISPKTYATEHTALWNACQDRLPAPAPTFLGALEHEQETRQ
jgi:hypothetical protein